MLEPFSWIFFYWCPRKGERWKHDAPYFYASCKYWTNLISSQSVRRRTNEATRSFSSFPRVTRCAIEQRASANVWGHGDPLSIFALALFNGTRGEESLISKLPRGSIDFSQLVAWIRPCPFLSSFYFVILSQPVLFLAGMTTWKTKIFSGRYALFCGTWNLRQPIQILF